MSIRKLLLSHFSEGRCTKAQSPFRELSLQKVPDLAGVCAVKSHPRGVFADWVDVRITP